MAADFTGLPDPGGIFSSVRKPDFHTPLSHWALSWPEARWWPGQSRPRIAKLTVATLRKRIGLPGWFSLAPKLTWRETTRSVESAQRTLWLGLPSHNLDPIEWLRLAEHFADPKALRVHVLPASSLNYVLLLTRGGRPLAYATRDVDLGAGHARHDFFTVARGLKGGGVGSQVVANAIAFYRDLGVSTIGLTAGLTGGGAVWPRFGFQPVNEAEWARVKRAIRANWLTLPAPAAGYPGGRAALDDAVVKILSLDEPDAIWIVSDLEPSLVVATIDDLSLNIGGWLLQGSHWRGILNLHDAAAELRWRPYLQDKVDAGVIKKPHRW